MTIENGGDHVVKGALRKNWALFLVALLFSFSVFARGQTELGLIAVAELPIEARTTLVLIKRGGPFPYAKDGVVFGNYERILPRHQRGYYREYTVPTPGKRNRGARRIVVGGEPMSSRERYYTADHYASFRRIQEE